MKSWKEKTDGERGREKGVIRGGKKEGWKDDGMAEGETEVKLIDGARAGRRIMSDGGRKRESIESFTPLLFPSPHHLSIHLFFFPFSRLFLSSSSSTVLFSLLLSFHFLSYPFSFVFPFSPSLLFLFHRLSVFLSSLVISFFPPLPIIIFFFSSSHNNYAAHCSNMFKNAPQSSAKTKANR